MQLARIALPSGGGDFVVHSGAGQGTFGVLTLAATPMGPICTRCELPDVTDLFDTGRALTELEIAPYSFSAAAINDVLQDAVGAAERYTRTIGRFEAPETHEAFHVIMRAALQDEGCRQFMTDLVNLSRAHTNQEFNFVRSRIECAPGSMGARLAAMTPEQVQELAAQFRHAYDLVQDALPWLSDGLRTLLGQLQRGQYAQARGSMQRRFKDKYVSEAPSQAAEDVGASPVAKYTVGGAPINVGKYRACTGCTCADPCADGSCESC